MEAFTGEIQLFPYSFTPHGWLHCNGQRMDARANVALHHLVGYRFGGEGNVFQLPDYRDHAPPGSQYYMADRGIFPGDEVSSAGYVACGAIILVPWTKQPAQWAVCDGAVLQAAAFPDLFAAIGNAFGGDGVGSFAVPAYTADAPPGSRYLIATGRYHYKEPWE